MCEIYIVYVKEMVEAKEGIRSEVSQYSDSLLPALSQVIYTSLRSRKSFNGLIGARS